MERKCQRKGCEELFESSAKRTLYLDWYCSPHCQKLDGVNK